MPTPEVEDYRTVFQLDAAAEVEPGTVVVAPSKDGWNDFGLQIRVDVVVHPQKGHALFGDSVELKGFFGFTEGQDRLFDVRALRQLLERAPANVLASENLPKFFTMLPDMAAYRQIVLMLGARDARRVLATLRDVVVAAEGPSVPPWLKVATGSQLFRKAFLRTTEAYFAWRNAETVLHGIELEQVGRISEELRIHFQLAGRPNEHQLAFRVAPREVVLPKRFSVVIGKNGVGKSQTLGRIANAAMRGASNLTDGNGERPSFNRILAFYPTAVASGVFPAENRRSRVWYRRYSLGGPGYGRRRQTTADLVVEIARSEERIGKSSRFGIFQKAVRSIENYEELALLTGDLRDPIMLLDQLLEGGEEEILDKFSSIDLKREVVRYVDGHHYGLSSGELSFVRFAALASLHIENSTLLLFDEPETHLHPNFISQFVILLDSLLEQTGSAAIIATHSVYFVREAFEDQVSVLRSAPDRTITVEVPLLKTFGADVGAISYFVFGEDEPSRLAKLVEERIMGRGESWESVFETYKDDLSLELLGEIRAEIEDGGVAGSDA